jgi:hypothetical protein
MFKLLKKKKFSDEEFLGLADKYRQVVNENNRLKEENVRVRLSVKPVPVVVLDSEDPEPKDPALRKSFVARVAAFHFDILDKKIKRMVSDIRETMMKVDRNTFGMSQGEYDLFLKGTENGLWLLHQWGEELKNEKVADDSGANDLTEEDKKELKDKLK